MNNFRELYQYKDMIINLTLYDLRTRYKGSIVGFLWTFLNPLLMLAIYSLVFSTVMRIDIDYYFIFLFSGLLPWILFQSAIQSGIGSIIRNGNLIKKIYFPRQIIPLTTLFGSVINYFFGLVVLIPFLFLLKINPIIVIIWLPIVLLVFCVFTYGLMLLLSSLNVFFRDIEHVFGVLLTAWFYFTPIVYPVDLIPVKYSFIFQLNPLNRFIVMMHDIFYYGRAPTLEDLWISVLFAVVILIVGKIVFNRFSKSFAEEV